MILVLKSKLLLIATVIVVSTPFYIYLYLKGMEDGIQTYKHSKAFMMTLESQYNFGLKDGLRWYY